MVRCRVYVRATCSVLSYCNVSIASLQVQRMGNERRSYTAATQFQSTGNRPPWQIHEHSHSIAPHLSAFAAYSGARRPKRPPHACISCTSLGSKDILSLHVQVSLASLESSTRTTSMEIFFLSTDPGTQAAICIPVSTTPEPASTDTTAFCYRSLWIDCSTRPFCYASTEPLRPKISNRYFACMWLAFSTSLWTSKVCF